MRDAYSAGYDLAHELDTEMRRSRYENDRGSDYSEARAPLRDSVECEFCDGTGRSFYDACDRWGEHITRECDCGECGGRGRVQKEEEDDEAL
jgi:DnaJ-class molecular chaperone